MPWEENPPRLKGPLSVILERSEQESLISDPLGEMSSSRHSRGSISMDSKGRVFSDSEFCSSEQALKKIEEDEADRLQFLNSGADSFFEKSGVDTTSSRHRLNKSGNCSVDSMGTYFQRKSSHPIQKTLDGSGWLDNSLFQQPEPSSASTPKPNLNYGTRKSGSGSSHTSKALQEQSVSSATDYSMMPTPQEEKSFVEALHETNGSICALAKFFNGPVGKEMGKDSMLAHVLAYCNAQSDTNASAESPFPNDLDRTRLSRYSGFEENLRPDSESSARSRSSRHGDRGSGHTVRAQTSSGMEVQQPSVGASRPRSVSEPEVAEEKPVRMKEMERKEVQRKESRKSESNSSRNESNPNSNLSNDSNRTRRNHYVSRRSLPGRGSSSAPSMSGAQGQIPSMASYWNLPQGPGHVIPPNSIPMFGYPNVPPIVIQIQCPCHQGNPQHQQNHHQPWIPSTSTTTAGNSCNGCSTCKTKEPLSHPK